MLRKKASKYLGFEIKVNSIQDMNVLSIKKGSISEDYNDRNLGLRRYIHFNALLDMKVDCEVNINNVKRNTLVKVNRVSGYASIDKDAYSWELTGNNIEKILKKIFAPGESYIAEAKVDEDRIIKIEPISIDNVTPGDNYQVGGVDYIEDISLPEINVASLRKKTAEDMSEENYEDYYIENFNFAGKVRNKKEIVEALNQQWNNGLEFWCNDLNTYTPPNDNSSVSFFSYGVELPMLLNTMNVMYCFMFDCDSGEVSCSIVPEDEYDRKHCCSSELLRKYEKFIPITEGSSDKDIARILYGVFQKQLKSAIKEYQFGIERFLGIF